MRVCAEDYNKKWFHYSIVFRGGHAKSKGQTTIKNGKRISPIPETRTVFLVMDGLSSWIGRL